MTSDFSYCVAIRTLGKAGDMFRQELESIQRQTIQPKRILVYIAEGYTRPDFTIGREEYVYVKKGMVAQRALPFTEIDTEYVLFLDDDVFLPDDAAEKLFTDMLSMDGDCIAADVFHPQNSTCFQTIYNFLTNMSYPRLFQDNRGFNLLRNASFSYNRKPEPKAYLSDDAAGPASLWKMSAYQGIHFEDELWLDRLGFAYQDDTLFFNKLPKNGYRMLIHYGTGIVHLDAKSSRVDYSKSSDKLFKRAMIWFIVWYRVCYNLDTNSRTEKTKCAIAFVIKYIHGIVIHTIYSMLKMNPKILIMYFKGNVNGLRYVHSEEYKAIPNFIINN